MLAKLVKVVCWVVSPTFPKYTHTHSHQLDEKQCAAGEYGELLLSTDAGLQPGEEPISANSAELVQTLETVLSRPTISPVGREYALTALMKLSTRLPDHSQRIQVG